MPSYMHEICLSKFPYDRNQYWVIIGAAMVFYDIREQTADLDLGCSKLLVDALEAMAICVSELPIAKDGSNKAKT